MDDIFDKVGVRDKHINKGLRQVAAAGFTFPSKRQFGRFLTLKAQVNGIAIPPTLLSKSKECKNYMDCAWVVVLQVDQLFPCFYLFYFQCSPEENFKRVDQSLMTEYIVFLCKVCVWYGFVRNGSVACSTRYFASCTNVTMYNQEKFASPISHPFIFPPGSTTLAKKIVTAEKFMRLIDGPIM